jgi:hypothetical protein
MKKINCLFIFIYCACLSLTAQNLRLEFPKLRNQTLRLYYFEGNRVDSLLIPLNKKGKAKVRFPKKDFRGLAQLIAPGVSGVELIVAEPKVKIHSKAAVLHKDSIIFSGSQENVFLYRYLHRKEQKQIPALYAAHLLQWIDFMNRLFEAEQERNPDKARAVREEMETTADIQTLYTSGQLWGTVHNFYISMFNRLDTPDKQREYAVSILTTAARLESPLREGFLAGALKECERFRWVSAQEIIKNKANEWR